MAKIKGPFLSMNAGGTIGKNITMRKKSNMHQAVQYSKPGSKNEIESSPKQKDQRLIMGLVTIYWQCMSPGNKATWETLAKAYKKNLTGYSLFLKTAQTNLLNYIGLSGLYSFNFSIFDYIPDLSGNNIHGYLKPDYPTNCPTLDSSINKKFGKAGSFNGTDQYIDCGNDEIINLTGPLSTCFWVYIKTGATYGYIYSKNLIGVSDIQYAAYYHSSDNNIYFLLNGSSVVTLPKNSILKERWYHVVLTCDLSNLNLYLNGLLSAGPVSYSTPLTPTDFPLNIGRRKPNNALLKGLLDNFILYNRALSPDEVKLQFKLFNPGINDNPQYSPAFYSESENGTFIEGIEDPIIKKEDEKL